MKGKRSQWQDITAWQKRPPRRNRSEWRRRGRNGGRGKATTGRPFFLSFVTI